MVDALRMDKAAPALTSARLLLARAMPDGATNAEPVRLDDDNKGDDGLVPAGIAVNAQLLGHQSVLNSSASAPCVSTKRSCATTCAAI